MSKQSLWDKPLAEQKEQQSKGSFAPQDTPKEQSEDLYLKVLTQQLEVSTNILKVLNDLRNHFKGLGEVPHTEPVVFQNHIDRIKSYFPIELIEKFNFKEDETTVTMYPKKYLGSELFSQTMSIVRKNGGAYISEGKNSHFSFPKA